MTHSILLHQSATNTPRARPVPRLRSLGVDPILLFCAFALLAFGLLMVYSTTGSVAHERFGDALMYVRRQGVAAGLGIVALIFFSLLKTSALRRYSVPCLFLSFILLSLPLVPLFGSEAGGAARWVNLFGVRFQPGEIVKVLFVIFLAGYLDRHHDRIHTFVQGIAVPAVLVTLVSILYLMHPDFGSSALLMLVCLAMILAAGARLRYVLAGGAVAAVAALILVVVSPYRMRRLLAFLDPEADPSGQGYQLIQSLIAVGSGEIAGVGLGASQQKLFFLPAAHTDFIFSVISEELGFLGAVAILALFLIILWRGLRIARSVISDTFLFSISIGMTFLLVAPALLNIGVAIGVLPTKGMVLPFISYGGTSLMSCLAVLGILIGVARTDRINSR